MVLVHVGAVVVLTTGETTTTWMLAVLADTTVTGGNVSTVLSGLGKVGRHLLMLESVNEDGREVVQSERSNVNTRVKDRRERMVKMQGEEKCRFAGESLRLRIGELVGSSRSIVGRFEQNDNDEKNGLSVRLERKNDAECDTDAKLAFQSINKVFVNLPTFETVCDPSLVRNRCRYDAALSATTMMMLCAAICESYYVGV